jgi:hypothetical protein
MFKEERQKKGEVHLLTNFDQFFSGQKTAVGQSQMPLFFR